jgi:hypothetical protein
MAAKVPAVPGAKGDSPLPKPNAKKCIGEEKTVFAGTVIRISANSCRVRLQDYTHLPSGRYNCAPLLTGGQHDNLPIHF